MNGTLQHIYTTLGPWKILYDRTIQQLRYCMYKGIVLQIHQEKFRYMHDTHEWSLAIN